MRPRPRDFAEEQNTKLLDEIIEKLTAEKRILLLEKEIEQLKKEIEELKQRQTILWTPIIVPITIPTDKGPSDCPDSGGWQPYRPWQGYTICLSD